MIRREILLTLLILAGCSEAEVQQAQSNVNAAVAEAQPTIEMACWLVQSADAGFQVYAQSTGADPSVVADETNAVNAANVTCTNPPANLPQAIADVLATYKSVVAATPTPTPSATPSGT
jgi:Tfp pilus assembly protein PilP